jgi:Protein of unknown function (DUF3667)
MPETLHEPGPCLNCGTHLWPSDTFCPKCGQKRLEREDMSIRHMFRESFLDYFHFDSGFFRTIVPLVTKPGWLTVEFMKGKRKSYVEPFKLFLVISVIYFILLPFSGETVSEQAENAGKSPAPSSAVDKKQSHTHYSVNSLPVSSEAIDSMRNEIDSTGIKQYVEKHFKKESGWTKLFLRQALKIMISTGQSFITVLEHTASKLIFLLIPVLALLLKLFYLRSKRLYFEHLIFSLHIHAFFFLFLILCLLAGFFIHISIWIIMLVFLIYTLLAIRRYYRQSTGKTLAKIFLISISYLLIALPIFMIVLMAVAVMTY